jgi:F0F1-type ATP synthase membrane subunit c/vacuolar-type H+-ATPase subunit K
MEGNILDAMRYVGAGLAMIGAAGAGVGIGLSVQGALTGMAHAGYIWQPADQHDPGHCVL